MKVIIKIFLKNYHYFVLISVIDFYSFDKYEQNTDSKRFYNTSKEEQDIWYVDKFDSVISIKREYNKLTYKLVRCKFNFRIYQEIIRNKETDFKPLYVDKKYFLLKEVNDKKLFIYKFSFIDTNLMNSNLELYKKGKMKKSYYKFEFFKNKFK